MNLFAAIGAQWCLWDYRTIACGDTRLPWLWSWRRLAGRYRGGVLADQDCGIQTRRRRARRSRPRQGRESMSDRLDAELLPEFLASDEIPACRSCPPGPRASATGALPLSASKLAESAPPKKASFPAHDPKKRLFGAGVPRQRGFGNSGPLRRSKSQTWPSARNHFPKTHLARTSGYSVWLSPLLAGRSYGTWRVCLMP